MTLEKKSLLRRILRDERAAAAILAAAGIFALVGFGALSVDVGYLYSAQRELQASANAAALAGAHDIGVGGNPQTTATSYSSVTGNKNANPNLTLAGITSTLFCFRAGGTCTTNQTSAPPNTPANGIQVQEQATVPLFFGKIFGMSSVQIPAKAVALAAGGVPHPLNVVFVIDTTGSMSTYDASCSATRIDCVRNGVKTLLGELWPCASNLVGCGAAVNGNVANPVDEAALMQFPGVESVPANYHCSPYNLTTAAYSGIKGITNNATAKGNNTLKFNPTPAFNTGPQALVSEAGTPTSSRTRVGNVLTFPGGMTAVSVNVPVQDLTNPSAIPAGTTVRAAPRRP
jgi:Flp pilus assembly protein TadG